MLVLLLCVNVMYSQPKKKSDKKTSDRINVTYSDADSTIPDSKIKYEPKIDDNGPEYLHNAGIAYSLQLNPSTINPGVSFNFMGSYQARLNFVHKIDNFGFGIQLTQNLGMGFGTPTSGSFGVSFASESMFGPEVSVGLDANSNSDGDVGFAFSPVFGLALRPNYVNPISYGPGMNLSLKYISYWFDIPLNMGFYYMYDMSDPINTGHLFGMRTTFIIGDY
jgi:hypothetical protein